MTEAREAPRDGAQIVGRIGHVVVSQKYLERADPRYVWEMWMDGSL